MDILSITAADPDHSAVIVETVDGGRLHIPWPSATWHGAAIEAWLGDDATRSIAPYAPPPFDPAAARATAIAALNALSAMITDQYPAAEVASWPIKDREARAILAGADPATTTVLAPLATALGAPVAAVATAIVTKADQFTGLMLWIEAQRSKLDIALSKPNAASAASALATLHDAIAAKRAEMEEGRRLIEGRT